jgi:hypothetical protein
MLSYSNYVFQRRVLVPPLQALRVATDRTAFDAGAVVAADEAGGLVVETPFRLIDVSPAWRWRADGRLVNPRGRSVARVELELGPWSADDCELLLRPRTARPDRWGSRRSRRYFDHAQRRVDGVQQLLATPANERVLLQKGV